MIFVLLFAIPVVFLATLIPLKADFTSILATLNKNSQTKYGYNQNKVSSLQSLKLFKSKPPPQKFELDFEWNL